MNVLVNYTRKINHFSLFFIPLLIRQIFPIYDSFERFIFGCVLATVELVIYIKPIRTRVPLIATMFLSFDRPEDRPHTLFWLFTQILAGHLVLVPMVVLFVTNGLSGILMIPLLILIFGDGLAEPVGVRFGKHKYVTYSFFSRRKYVRTLEGSACVLLASIVVVILHRPYFMPIQFVVALIAVPIIMTIVEAFSPHTWDTPTLFLAGYGSLYGIMRLV
jgi:dolichol kinase